MHFAVKSVLKNGGNTMELTFATGNILTYNADTIVLNLFEGVADPGGATGSADGATDGAIRRLIAGGDFTGKLNQTAILYPTQGLSASRVILVGLGQSDAFSLDRARQAAGSAARVARDLGAEHLASIVHGGGEGGLDYEKAVTALVEGTGLALYRYTAYRTKPSDDKELVRFTVVELDENRKEEAERGAAVGRAIVAGVTLARDLGNTPGNDLTPVALAERLSDMAAETGLSCEVWDEKRLEKEGMRTILAVGKGSANPPRFIILEHQGDGADSPVAFIGKGITFDTGGISLKPTENMWDMKFDMGGAAAVAGAMRAVAELKPKQRVLAVIAAAENMPGSRALKPGDIIRSMLGKTIEIRSTDAEGRLVLADAVAWMARQNPIAAIDLATLTGACVTALGNSASGLFSNNDELVAGLEAAGERTGETVWHMPILEAHRDQIKGDYADIKNTGGRPGGACTAAAFIEEFVGDMRWAHLDIAGTAWTDKSRPYVSKGGTGVGVRLLLDWLQNRT
jgi:leucyl aminopeptidase